ncbi:MAG: carbohydrate porin [Chlamydiae bacterium]|nr:carbohydrate porin [Chlamydiota bacterium]
MIKKNNNNPLCAFIHRKRVVVFGCLVSVLSFPRVDASFDPELEADYNLIERPQSLIDSGVYAVLNYVSDAVTNPIGGQSRGFAYCDSYFLGLGYNFGNTTPLKGFSINTGFVFRTGHNLTSKINNQFSVNQVYGGQTWKIYSLSLSQWIKNDLINIKIGRFAPSDDFLASPLYYRFVNNSINGTPVAIVYNIPFATYPNGVWGGYLSVKPNRHFVYKTGVYSTNYQTFANRYHGFKWTFDSPYGVLFMNEADLMTGSEDNTKNKPGNYKIGLAYQFADVENHFGGVSKGNYSLYFLADQVVCRLSATRYITPFMGVLYTPPQKSVFPFFTFAGLAFDGPIKSRSEDVLSMMASCSFYSSSFENWTFVKQTYEIDMEINYQINFYRYFNLTPSLQYIVNPHGYNTIQNAWVLGLQTYINF